jgi:hypothetical protein
MWSLFSITKVGRLNTRAKFSATVRPKNPAPTTISEGLCVEVVSMVFETRPVKTVRSPVELPDSKIEYSTNLLSAKNLGLDKN